MIRDIVLVGVGGQGTVLASRLIAQAAINEDQDVRTAETIGMAQRGGSVLGYVRLSAGTGVEGAAAANTGGTATASNPVASNPVASNPSSTSPLSPIIGPGQADLLIAFEPAEAARNLHLLKPGGCLISATQPIVPLTAQQAKDPAEAYNLKRILNWLAEHGNGQAPQAGNQPADNAQHQGPYQVLLIDAQAILDELGSSRVLNVVLLGVALATNTLGVAEESLLTAMQALIKPALLDLNRQALDKGKAAVQ